MDYMVEGISEKDSKMNLAVTRLLEQEGIQRDGNLDYTCVILDDIGNPVATGSCFGNTLRCMAVDHRYQGRGLLNLLIRHLTEYQISRGNTHLFIYTKMREARFFQDLGFYEIANVDGMITFLENRKNGFPNYLNSLKRESHDVESLGKQVGAVVMNANPFTMGHLFLVEEAAKKCEILLVFVVSEDCSMFPFSVRQDLVKKGTAHLKNVICHASGPYIISQGTFPSYFLKEEAVVCEAHAKLDIAIFEIIARELGITNRFVGEEKKSMVTSMYNRVMLEQLNKVGIKAEEIPRKKINGEVISASKVRQWIHDGQLESVCPFVPKTTWEYLYSEEARPVLEAIQKAQDVIHY